MMRQQIAEEPCQSFLVIPAPLNQHATILGFYRSHHVLETSQQLGAAAGAIVRSDAAEELVVTSLWTSTQDYGNWVNSGERAKILQTLGKQGFGRDARGWSAPSRSTSNPTATLQQGLHEAFPGRIYKILFAVEPAT
jgi:heme-degrading monooxygenase HmoA